MSGHMKNIAKIYLKFLAIMAFVTMLAIDCRQPAIFTEIDFSFKSLDDIFPEQFASLNRSLTDESGLLSDASDFRMGRYGTILTLEVWQFKTPDKAKESWQTLTTTERKQILAEYDQVKTTENRLNFKRATGISGIIWTNKMFLFRILAENNEVMRLFMKESKIGRLQ